MKITRLLAAGVLACLTVTGLTACGPTAGDNAIAMDHCIKFIGNKYQDLPSGKVCALALKTDGQVKFTNTWENVTP